MHIEILTHINDHQKEAILQLWNKEYPVNLSLPTITDLDNYLNSLPGITYYLLVDDHNSIAGWAMTFSREEEKWFAITIDSKLHGKGHGTLLLNKLKENNTVLLGWVIDHERYTKANGAIYPSPLLFYKKNGFTVSPGIRLEIPVLSAVQISWQRA